jgi:TPR repeat protein
MTGRWTRSGLFAAAAWLAAVLGAALSAGLHAAPAVAAAAEPAPPVEIDHMRKGAATGDRQHQYDLGVLMLCQSIRLRKSNPAEAARRFADAEKLLEDAARQGHIQAQSVRGWMLMSGGPLVPTVHDDKRASQWLQRAAERNDTEAQNNLGVLYATGRGVQRDEAAAERWFRAAADKDAEVAKRNLEVLLGGGASRPVATRASAGLHPALVRAGCRNAKSRT